MLGVSHYTDTFLKAIEDELTVGLSFADVETGLNLPPTVLDRPVNPQKRNHLLIHRRNFREKLPLPRELSISLPDTGCP